MATRSMRVDSTQSNNAGLVGAGTAHEAFVLGGDSYAYTTALQHDYNISSTTLGIDWNFPSYNDEIIERIGISLEGFITVGNGEIELYLLKDGEYYFISKVDFVYDYETKEVEAHVPVCPWTNAPWSITDLNGVSLYIYMYVMDINGMVTSSITSEMRASSLLVDLYYTPKEPILKTEMVSLSQANAVVLEGQIDDLGSTLTFANPYLREEYGFVYTSGTNTPTISNTKIILGYAEEPLFFKHIEKGLAPGTYSFRVYMKGDTGTNYGNTLILTVPLASKIGELTKEGNLNIAGEINERLPAVTNGLISHFPFDGTDMGESFSRNLLDTSLWSLGTTGSQGYFGVNGSTSEANIIEHENPWGDKEITWTVLKNDDASGSDGGWNVTGRAIDRTKKYRLSVWIKRENIGNGSTYFGCQASTVYNISANTVNTNPYFTSGKFPETYDNWVLFVAYIHPYDYAPTSSDPTNGLYSINGTRHRGVTDFKWSPTATVGGHRTYLYYSTAVDERQYWVRPRFEICDGTEATIQDLLEGKENRTYPIINTNTTLTDNGIGVEESTTNLITNSTVSSYSPYHNVVRDGHRFSMTTVLNNTYLTLQLGSDLIGKTLAISGFMKKNGEPFFVNSSVPNTYQPTVNTQRRFVDPVTGYFEFVCNYTVSSNWVFHASMTNKIGDVITIDNFQVEEKTFATSFVEGTRGTGRIDIPFTLKPPYSINIWHKGKRPLSEIVSQATSPMIFQLNDYHTNASISFWNYSKNLTIYIKGDTGTGWSGSGNQYRYTDSIWDAKEHMYTFVAIDNRNFKIYMDGAYLGQQTSTVDVTNISYLSMGNTSQPNANYKDLSTYNRILSDKEVAKLYSPSFQVKKTGQLITNKVIEKVALPREATHIPFDLDATSTNKVATPTAESNVVYEDGSIWVGEAMTNLIGGVDYDESTMKEEMGWRKLKNTGEGWIHYYTNPSVLQVGQIYTASFVAFNPSDKPVYLIVDLYGSAGGFVVQPKENKKIVHTMKSSLQVTDPFPDGVQIKFVEKNDIIWTKNAQIEKGTYASAYTEGTRGLSALRYDVNKLLTNTWEEFTFVLQAKYSASGNYRLSGAWSKWYFGVNVNGSLVFSWVDGSQKTTTSSGVSIPIGEWVTIGVTVKNGGGVDLYYNGNRVGGLASGLALPNTNNTFHLNGFDSGSSYSLNAFVRDVIFVSRVLTTDEMKQLHSTNMRSLKNGLQVKTNIREKAELYPLDTEGGQLPGGVSIEGHELTHLGNIKKHFLVSGSNNLITSTIAAPIDTHETNLTHTPYGVATGTNDKTIVLIPDRNLYEEGLSVAFRNIEENTGPVKIKINDLPFKKLLTTNGSELGKGDLLIDSIYTVYYDGTSFRM